VQLIDAETGKHLWAERFEKPIADLFDMQDEIVSRLANALDAQLIVAEAQRAERSPNHDATDLHFQGMASIFKGLVPEHLTQGRNFFERALAIDPRCIGALVGMAMVDLTMAGGLLADDRAGLCSAAETNAIKALSLAPHNATAHLVLGDVYIFTNRASQGIAECEQALALNRNLADAHSYIGFAKYCMGRAAETEGHIREAFRLSPRDVFHHRWLHAVGQAKIQLGADAEAVGWLRRSIEADRNYPLAYFTLAAALGLLGALDEARKTAKAGLALNPDFTIRRLRASQASDNPSYLTGRDRICTGMRLAGVNRPGFAGGHLV
jgi:tetratricopeptide (TPR) repeat protein